MTVGIISLGSQSDISKYMLGVIREATKKGEILGDDEEITFFFESAELCREFQEINGVNLNREEYELVYKDSNLTTRKYINDIRRVLEKAHLKNSIVWIIIDLTLKREQSLFEIVMTLFPIVNRRARVGLIIEFPSYKEGPKAVNSAMKWVNEKLILSEINSPIIPWFRNEVKRHEEILNIIYFLDVSSQSYIDFSQKALIYEALSKQGFWTIFEKNNSGWLGINGSSQEVEKLASNLEGIPKLYQARKHNEVYEVKTDDIHVAWIISNEQPDLLKQLSKML